MNQQQTFQKVQIDLSYTLPGRIDRDVVEGMSRRGLAELEEALDANIADIKARLEFERLLPDCDEDWMRRASFAAVLHCKALHAVRARLRKLEVLES